MIPIPNFKLIAIIPLSECDNTFSKALDPGKVYQFHSEYNIQLDSKGNSVAFVLKDPNKGTPTDLYRLANGIQLTVSAIVGKNGTGKSSLMEMFYRAIYYLGVRTNFGTKRLLSTSVEKLEAHLKWLKNELHHLLTETGLPYDKYLVDQNPKDNFTPEMDQSLYLLQMVRRHQLTFDIKRAEEFKSLHRIIAAELNSKIIDTLRDINVQEEHEEKMEQKFHVSIIYETEEGIFELKCAHGKVSQTKFLPDGIPEDGQIPQFDLEKFFYTVSLNYSHHGLNAVSLGKWVNKLFHKNDAYITPLVLNPMRDDGNVDINKELRLSRERLASNILYELLHQEKSLQLDKYSLSKFMFSIKKNGPSTNHDSVVDPKTDEVFHWDLIQTKYGIKKEMLKRPNGQLALEYLSRKLTKILRNYTFLMEDPTEDEDPLKEYLDQDNSHVTRKIRQTVNYLKADVKVIHEIWSTIENPDPAFVHVPTEQLISYMKSFKLDFGEIPASKLIEYAFPGFFDVDFEFNFQDNPIRLSAMSSGEQQLIFNSNAILYHLYNIQSVAQNNTSAKANKRPRYRYVNIILDEMELYYHPEMQRRLVSDLLRDLNKLSPDMGIQGIHVSILTHSPFILSDIPVQSTLHLRNATDKARMYGHQSFGANIHEILRKDFFLNDGFMGEHAKREISLVIDSLKAHQYIPKDIMGGKTKLMINKRKKYAKDLFFDVDFLAHGILSKEQCENRVAIIGEPVLYQTLMELYQQAFGKEAQDFIQDQINFLQRLKNNKL